MKIYLIINLIIQLLCIIFVTVLHNRSTISLDKDFYKVIDTVFSLLFLYGLIILINF